MNDPESWQVGTTDSHLPMAIAATGFAFLLVQLDVSVVNVALPAMGVGLGPKVDGLTWIVDAYTLSFAALLLFADALGDRIGARKVFLAGRVGARPLMLGGLALAALSYGTLSLIGGTHPDLMLHLGLIGAALGIGIVVPSMTSTLISRVPAERGGVASGVLNTVRQAGGALGVALFGAMLAAGPAAGVRLALSVSAALVLAAALVVMMAGPVQDS